MKPVGILTFHRGPNHGGFLQAYELAKAVEHLGRRAEIINYQNATHRRNERIKPWVYRRPSKLIHDLVKRSTFSKSVNLLPLSAFTTDANEIDWNQYSCILIGADVVWDYRAPHHGHDPIYFGSFRERFDGVLASYAPSCGTVDINTEIPTWVENGIKGFDRISVRDTNTQAMAMKTGLETAPIVADPTWLPINNEALPSESRNQNSKTTGNDSYIAIYGHNIDAVSAEELRKYAKNRNLTTVSSGYLHPWTDKCLSRLDPFEWIDHLKNADCVFTGTFHGALYAARLGKRFGILPNPNINAKLSTPMQIGNMESRYVESPDQISEILDTPMDLEMMHQHVKSHVSTSWEYLSNVLAKA